MPLAGSPLAIEPINTGATCAPVTGLKPTRCPALLRTGRTRAPHALEIDARFKRMASVDFGDVVSEVEQVVRAKKRIAALEPNVSRVGHSTKGGVGNQVQIVDLRVELTERESQLRARHTIDG